MSRARAALPWMVLAAGLAVATAPAWRIPLFGFSPGLDAVLRLAGCGGRG